MTWKGTLIEEGLKEKAVMKAVKVVERIKSKETICKIEVEDSVKDEFVRAAMKSIREGYFINLCKDKLMYVVFKEHMFKFSRGYPELETARRYGESVGIPKERMPFEKMILDPFCREV